MVRAFILLLFVLFSVRSQTLNVTTANAGKVSATPEMWSIGFWGHYAPLENATNIEWQALTHVVDFCATNDDLTGAVGFAKVPDTNLLVQAHLNGVKVLLGLRPSAVPWEIATNGNLPILVSNLMSEMTNRGFDGIDIDYEPRPLGTYNINNISNVLTALRASLGTNLLTWDYNRGDYASMNPEVVNICDRVNVMTYDASDLTRSWFNNPIYGYPLTNYNYEPMAFTPWPGGSSAVHWQWLYHTLVEVSGVNPKKLNFSIAFYGYEHGNGVPPTYGPGVPATSPPEERVASVHYRTINSNKVLHAIAHYEPMGRCAWYPISTGWVDYEDERAVADKCKFVINHGLGGVMIFAMDLDYDELKTPKHPLLRTIRRNLLRP